MQVLRQIRSCRQLPSATHAASCSWQLSSRQVPTCGCAAQHVLAPRSGNQHCCTCLGCRSALEGCLRPLLYKRSTHAANVRVAQPSYILQYLGRVGGKALARRRQGEGCRQPSRSHTRQQAPVRRQAGWPRVGTGRLATALLPCQYASGALRAVPPLPPAAAEGAGCCYRGSQQHLHLRCRHEHAVCLYLRNLRVYQSTTVSLSDLLQSQGHQLASCMLWQSSG